jgi:LysR family transcriptional regulator, nitrogen assimilation regulatory protein
MDLRQLRYFTVLAAQQHFGRAADVLHIAQPALTRQIKLLEDELGVQLFERHPRGASLTEAGLFLLGRSQFLLRYAQQMRDDMSTHQREPAGSVAIGLSPGMAPLLAVPLMLRIQNDFPAVRLRFVEGFAPALHEMVLNGEVDVAVLNGSVRAIDLVMEPLLREQMCLIGRHGDERLQRKQIAVQQLTGIPLVLTGLAKSGVRLELEAVAARVGTELEAVVEVESLDVAKRLILAGVGLTVHFAAVVNEEIVAKRLAATPIEGLYLDRMIARAAGRPPSRATVALIGILREVVENKVGAGQWPYATLTSG